ncbi:HAMP domain-containing protein [Mycetocola manganoxydans]|uniref:histidine kinase n=1 Tax=Mycetocola manganoxydans TaxID=699879 RepID=A0A3L6ZR83_9MICO|nr:ATP-binding protein [Mycetocola manganoxydans]RLP70289.1 HAMP domain-containing protein [Mycetocola manganoxydans]
MAEPTRRRMSLRSRIVLAATAVVAVALLLGAAGFVLLLQQSLRDGVQAAAEQSLNDLVSRVEASGLESISTDAPPPATPDDDDDDDDNDPDDDDDDPVTQSTEDFLANYDDDEAFFQVIDENGTVVAASENATGIGILVLPTNGDARTISLPGESAQFVTVGSEADGLTILTGRSIESIGETTETVTRLLAIALPVLLAFVALTTWFVVGRALRPVERMRREVDDVTSANLHQRIADPGSSDEIGRLAATMNRMLDRLDVSQKAQRRFISDASHELKSPLASMRQYAEVAQAHPDRVGVSDLSEVVLDEGARLERLVQGMLVLAKADEHSLAPTRTAVDLDDLVLAEARRLKDMTPHAIDTSAVGPARVLGDVGLLGQALRNVADNAARHAAGRVRFELSESGGQVLLAISDDGNGIPDDARERVFERFVRLDEARARESGGSGLGLSIVREIAQAHGGSVIAIAGELGGARFEMRMPAASDSGS